MKNGFRQSMAWLHTWVGLSVGWILFFVFVTGTASYATQEITRWMQPEIPLPVKTAPNTSEQFKFAYQYLLDNPESQHSAKWTIGLIHEGRNSSQLTAAWEIKPPPGAKEERNQTIIKMLDPNTGEVLHVEKPRETAGGRALLRMHYSLHYLPHDAGVWIVGICAMFMFVAIISGIITHKKIFKDFFTFRPAKGQRSWLDAHNVVSVMALPFFIMITYSGLLFFMYTYMKPGVSFTYGFDEKSEQTYYQELRKLVGSNRLVGHVGGGGNNNAANNQENEDSKNTEQMKNGRELGEGRSRRAGGENRTSREGSVNREETRSPQQRDNAEKGSERRKPSIDTTIGNQISRFADISAMVSQVEKEWGDKQIRSITINAAVNNKEPAKVVFAPIKIDTIRRSRGTNLEFNAFTGEQIVKPVIERPIPESFGSSMLGLHEGLYAGRLMRWLYLMSGMLGCAMIATGLVLWTTKRQKQTISDKTSFGHNLVEKLNVATIAGLPFGLAMYFWANRFVPVDVPQRGNWEINTLFISWLAVFIYIQFRPVMQSWRELLTLTAVAFLLIPVINAFTTDKHLVATLLHGDWVRVSVESVMIFAGAIFSWAALQVHRKIVTANDVSVKEQKKSSSPKSVKSNTQFSDEENPEGAV